MLRVGEGRPTFCRLAGDTPLTSSSAHQSSADGVSKPGVGTGLRCLFGGVGWIVSTPDIWLVALVPLAIALGLMGGLFWMTFGWVPERVDLLLGPRESAVGELGAWVAKALAVAAGLIVSVIVSFALAQPLSAPALDRIVRRVMRDEGIAPGPETPFFVEIGRSIQSVAISLLGGLPLLALLAVGALLFPAASVVLVPGKMFVAAVTVAWDLCDVPLSVKGLSVGHRIDLVRRHFSAVVGFGLGMALASLVPLLVFLLLPAGVAGATRLIARVERFEAATNPA
ncbi:MAG: EI24 domain-containing protein [Myxococcota bacterium]